MAYNLVSHFFMTIFFYQKNILIKYILGYWVFILKIISKCFISFCTVAYSSSRLYNSAFFLLDWKEHSWSAMLKFSFSNFSFAWKHLSKHVNLSLVVKTVHSTNATRQQTSIVVACICSPCQNLCSPCQNSMSNLSADFITKIAHW